MNLVSGEMIFTEKARWLGWSGPSIRSEQLGGNVKHETTNWVNGGHGQAKAKLTFWSVNEPACMQTRVEEMGKLVG